MNQPPISIEGIGMLPVLEAPMRRVQTRKRLTLRQLKQAMKKINKARSG